MLNVWFDKATDRAGMDNTESACDALFDAATMTVLGSGSTC